MTRFLMAGGGTGGHVIPAIAVARELHQRGHEAVFVGTRRGLEATLVPQAGFPMEWIEIGGLKGLGLLTKLRALWQLPFATMRVWALMRRLQVAAVFSMGGYVAGPVAIAAVISRTPLVVMEPNAVPGFTNRRIARWVARALLSFEQSANYFPRGRSELTGVPVRDEFFRLPAKPRGEVLSLLITGGSRGSRTLNNAVRESLPLFRQAPYRVRIVHQTGAADYERVAPEFAASGIEGEVAPFIGDMPAAFAEADLIICRSGANAVAELAAAGRAAVLVPFPFAADHHQLRNAEAFVEAGAARLVLDSEMNGRRFFEEVSRLAADPDMVKKMSVAARRLACPGAAVRAVEVLEEVALVRH